MKKVLSKIEYNSPVILTFAICAAVIFMVDELTGGQFMRTLFIYRGGFMPLNLLRLLLWPLGHASWEHLLGNMTIILLIGPMLEEKYKSHVIFIMMILSAIIIGIFQAVVFGAGILGASGIAFMFIIMTSFTNMKEGKIPLTFIVVCLLFLTREVYNGLFVKSNVSELAHLMGAFLGASYVFLDRLAERKSWGEKC